MDSKNGIGIYLIEYNKKFENEILHKSGNFDKYTNSLKFLNENLEKIIKYEFEDLWIEIKTEKYFPMIISFVMNFDISLIKLKHLKNEIMDLLYDLYKNIFIVIYRFIGEIEKNMKITKDSIEYQEILYYKMNINTLWLIKLCELYGENNKVKIKQILNNAFLYIPQLNTDFKLTISKICDFYEANSGQILIMQDIINNIFIISEYFPENSILMLSLENIDILLCFIRMNIKVIYKKDKEHNKNALKICEQIYQIISKIYEEICIKLSENIILFYEFILKLSGNSLNTTFKNPIPLKSKYNRLWKKLLKNEFKNLVEKCDNVISKSEKINKDQKIKLLEIIDSDHNEIQ